MRVSNHFYKAIDRRSVYEEKGVGNIGNNRSRDDRYGIDR